MAPRRIGCLREALYLADRATHVGKARDWWRPETTRCHELRQGPPKLETGLARARGSLWVELHDCGMRLPCELRGLTFELTPRAEAGGVSRDCDDSTTGAGPAYDACRSTSGVERGVRRRSLTAPARLTHMNARVDHLLEDALRLSAEERSAVAAALIDSLESAEEAAVPDAWRSELLRRRDALRAGRTAGAPWQEVRARLGAL